MKPKALNFIIPLQVYPFDVMVSLGEKDTDLIAKLNKMGVDTTDKGITDYTPSARGRCIMFEGGQTLIRIYRYDKSCDFYGHLAHEIFHAVEFIMDRIGMKLVRESDEAYAYLISYLTTEIHKRLV
jgi:hypothetical protein